MERRIIALGALVAVLFVYTHGLELGEVGRAHIEECRKENNLEMDQIKEAFENLKAPVTANGKCFVGCVMEKAGVLEDGKLNTETAKNLNKLKLKEKPEILEKANIVVDKCAAEVANPGEKCEYAAKLTECALKYGKEMGIPHPTFTD